MTTAAICATREVSWSPSFYRGEQYDSDLGLYYLRARYYNPSTGRFMSRDPLEFQPLKSWNNPVDSSKLHRYLYAGGDPVNRIDPRGREDLVEYVMTTIKVTVAVVKSTCKLITLINIAFYLDSGFTQFGPTYFPGWLKFGCAVGGLF